MTTPYFSIIITAFNRERMIRRCVDSCLAQTFNDFEVVVVDDASTDRTPEVLQSMRHPKLVVVRHAVNKGICPARDTCVKTAKGRWIVMIDSDHALLPHTLESLYPKTQKAAADVGVIGARYRWDDGSVTPRFVPDDAIDYEGRIRWVEEEGGTDYLSCTRREVYETVHWPSDRRGPLDTLFQLDLAKQWKVKIHEDILALEFSDAPNSQTRSLGLTRVRIMLQNAADMAWHYEEILDRHGEALEQWGAKSLDNIIRAAALNHFLSGDRKAGLKRVAQYLFNHPASAPAWGILVFGMMGPRAAAYANALKNRI